MLAFANVLLDPTGPLALSFVVGGAVGVAVTLVTSRRRPIIATAENVDVPSAWPPVISTASPSAARAAAPDLDTRVRTGRLPLPQQVVDLGACGEPGVARANAFADWLAALPVETWIDVGHGLIADGESIGARSMACAMLDTAIADRGLAIAAWYARDTVETSAFLASCAKQRWSSKERRAFARAHGAAEKTALALLAKSYLPTSEVACLCSPFAAITSADSILSIDERAGR